MTLIYDLDLQTSASYSLDLLTHKSSRSKVNRFGRESGNKQTDGQKDAGHCITSVANAVGVGVLWPTIFRGQFPNSFYVEYMPFNQ